MKSWKEDVGWITEFAMLMKLLTVPCLFFSETPLEQLFHLSLDRLYSES